jgi:hypothetical protein
MKPRSDGGSLRPNGSSVVALLTDDPTNHVDKEFTVTARMLACTHLDVSVPVIEGDVPLHPHIRIQPNFADADCDGPLIGKVEKRSPMTSMLFGWADRNAVEQQMIGVFLQHCNTYIAITALQNPDLVAIDPGLLRAVDLHQFAQAIAPPARLMRRGQTMPSVLPQPIGDHPTAQGLA